MYFLIYCSEDGVTVEGLDKKTLLERLDENYYGDIVFYDSFPNTNPNYWRKKKALIIKGSVVTPKPETVIEKYTID